MSDLLALKDDRYNPINVGLRLKALRAHVGVTQSDLAEILGTSQSSVAGWESGEIRPSFEAAGKLKETYGVTYDWLYQGDHSWLPHALAISLAGHFERMKARYEAKRERAAAKLKPNSENGK